MQTEHSLSRETQDALPGAVVENASQQSDAGAKQNWSGPHPVDIRLTIPLLSGRYYFTILAGHERRSADRLRADRRLHPLLKVGNVALFLVFGSVVGLALLSVIQLLAYWVLL